jgi:acyl-CoA reductase-like NAD-dependent aldehyde dehydrogenase
MTGVSEITEIEVLDPATARHTGRGAVWTSDLGRALTAARAIRAGVVWVNDSQIAPVQTPWGGVRQSGIGRELGPRGLEDYVEAEHIYLNHA